MTNDEHFIPEAGNQAQAEQWSGIAVCPYCFKEHPTDVTNNAGECPTVACCGENHCLDRNHPLMQLEYIFAESQNETF